VIGLVEVTRKYRFSASHRLHAPQLGPAENRELYGKCNNPFGHGHNYEIAVTVRGPVEALSGRAVDPELLDGLVRRQVLEPFEHRNLNEEVAAFRTRSAPAFETELAGGVSGRRGASRTRRHRRDQPQRV